MLLFTGLRIAELAALDRDDVAISARKGVVTVRRGKGERYRQVPLNAEVRDTLDAWLDKRNALPGSDGPALLLSLKGRRLSARAIDLTVRHLGQEADVETSAHTLRHTCLTPARECGRPGRRTPSCCSCTGRSDATSWSGRNKLAGAAGSSTGSHRTCERSSWTSAAGRGATCTTCGRWPRRDRRTFVEQPVITQE